MNTELRPYSEMKDSGIGWLEEVPSHWKVVRLKHWVGINKETLPETTDPTYEFDYIDIGSVTTGQLTTNPERIQFATAPSRARRIVRTGDTIISTVRTYLKAVWHAEESAPDLVASTGFAILTPNFETSPKFVSYVVQGDIFTNRVTAESIGIAYPAIPETKLNTFEVGIPPLPEQTAIVRYLDYVDRRVQQLTRAKRKLVALLTEQKQAVIQGAVTRGLEPNVPMKNSGIGWLSEVPEHWEVRKLKQCCDRFYAGGTPDSGTAEFYCSPQNGIPWLMIADMTRQRRVRATQKHITEEGRASRNLECLPIGTLLYSMYANLGAVSILEIEATVNQAIIGLWPRSTVLNREFCLYSLENLRPHVALLASTSTQANLNAEKVRGLRIPLPPLSEQNAIVEHLDRATADIDAAIARANREIELLDEYRTRLIADVVTGKLDVREAAASLPEVDPLEMEEESL